MNNKNLKHLLCLGVTVMITLIVFVEMSGQDSFKSQFKSSNPVPNGLPIDEQVAIHTTELELAIKNKDSLTILYSYLYLIDDLLKKNDLTEAMKNILAAENFVSASSRETWKGQVSHRKGSVYTYLGDYPKAITQFEISLEQSTIGRDSQNMAINLEQLGALNGYTKAYDISDSYYERAFTLIEEKCSRQTLAIALSNYGNIQLGKGDFKKAEKAYLKSMQINGELQNTQNETICKGNLAILYYETNEIEKALDMTLECIDINNKNNWGVLLIDNYNLLSELYKKSEDWEKSYTSLSRYLILSDSIKGLKIREDITNLESENKILLKNLEISKTENALHKVEEKYRNSLLIGVISFIILLLIFLYFLVRRKINRHLLNESRTHVLELTKTLSAKNARLLELELKHHTYEKDVEIPLQDDIINPYSDKILTSEDWQAFKGSFEKAYPKFIRKIRIVNPTISEAEERLFLLLRLDLTSIEISNVLGVLPNTVKKTRGRLRKRLNIDDQIALDDYVRSF